MAGRPPMARKVPVEGSDSLPETPLRYKAQRDFMAYYKTQLVSFARDQILDERIGDFMYSNGAPVDIVENS